MPYKNKEDRKEYQRLYYQKNKKILDAKRDKEKIKQYIKQYIIDNKEKVTERNRLYQIKNKQKLIEYRQTDTFKKSHRIGQWKHRGILCFDWNLLYDLFVSTTNCEFCNVELTIDKKPTSTTRCLDHDHSITDRFNIRGVLCHSCNNKDVFKQTTTNSL